MNQVGSRVGQGPVVERREEPAVPINDMIADPAKYNLKNITDACYGGGYFVSPSYYLPPAAQVLKISLTGGIHHDSLMSQFFRGIAQDSPNIADQNIRPGKRPYGARSPGNTGLRHDPAERRIFQLFQGRPSHLIESLATAYAREIRQGKVNNGVGIADLRTMF